MVNKEDKINSKSYWDDRFVTDWEGRNGKAQSRFFGELAVDNFPQWFIDKVRDDQLSICDWGCALGDGTELLLEKFPKSKVTGVDFSEEAIKKAKIMFPDVDFLAKDFLADKDSGVKYDILFSSNTLEHFNNAWDVFDKISKKARKYIVLLLPFREVNPISEHFSSFEFSTTEYNKNGWILVHSFVIDAKSMHPSHWDGEQILLIFANEKEVIDSKLMLSDLIIHTAKNFPKYFETEIRDLKIRENILEEENSKNNQMAEELQKTVNWLRSQKTDLREQNEKLEQELAGITEGYNKVVFSRRWITISKIIDKVNRFFPKDSLRRDFLLAIYHSLKFFLNILRKVKRSLINLISFGKSFVFIVKHNLFDSKYYQKNMVKKIHLFPMFHYLFLGYKKNLNPSKYFDSTYYELLYPEVLNSNTNHLIHYVNNQDPNKVTMMKFAEYFENKFDKSKETLAFQLDSFDKGGLEEVVLSLATNDKLHEKYNIIILVAGEKLGHISDIAQERGVPVFVLKCQENLLDYIISKLNITICHLHYSLFGLYRYRANGVKTIYTIHNNYIWGNKGFVKERKKLYKLVDFFVAVSNQVGEYFSAKFNVSKNKIKVIPNGVDMSILDSFKLVKRKDFGLEPKDFVFINVSSFIGTKFHPLMIAAMGRLVEKYPDMKLLLVGNVADEKYFENVKDLIKKYQVENNVIVVDYVPKKKLIGLLKIANCFVLPSLTEGFSISTIEAMYNKLPLVLSDVGGAREAIDNKDIGIIIKNPYENILNLDLWAVQNKYMNDQNLSNLNDLVDAMSNMYENCKEWKKKGELGIKKVREMFNMERVVQEYLNVFQTACVDNESTVLPVLSDGKIDYKNDSSSVFKSQPLVSVMLPVFNHADFVIDSIESVRKQTYRNWELVILDDGSTDNLLKILEKYSDDSRIRVYSQKNQKLPRTLSHLHQLVKGEFLTWTSADNIMEPDMLKQSTDFLLANPECVLCYADVSLIDGKGEYYMQEEYQWQLRDPERPYIVRLPRDASALGAEAKNFINASFMYRKEASDILGGEYSADLTGLEDYDYWLRLSRVGKIMHIHNEVPLYRYRVHKKTMSEELMTVKNREHMERMDKFIEYEHRRQDFANSGYNIRISKNLDIAPLAFETGAEKTIYIQSFDENIPKEKNVFPVTYDNAFYHINFENRKYFAISVGYNISPLCSKARYIQHPRYEKTYVNVNNRPIVGIHFDTNNIDIQRMRSIIERNPEIYFVFCDTTDSGKGMETVTGFNNAVYLGNKKFGEPYETYASFNAFMIPPMVTVKGVNLDAQKVLAWSCNKHLIAPNYIYSTETLPLVSYCDYEKSISTTDILKPDLEDEYLLSRYIEFYSQENRLRYLVRNINGILQDTAIDRPDFDEKPVEEEYPKMIRDTFYKFNGQDFKSEIDYWDKEMSLTGSYPQAIISRSNPDLMGEEYPKILETYRKKLKAPIKVLDVGSGPLSMLGYGHYSGLFELECVDPLGDIYNELLKKYNLTMNYKIMSSPGESLSMVLEENSYDIVWIHNALDHSKDPAKVISEMAKLLKKGGYLLILGWANEGSFESFYGLHQHDLYLKNKQLWDMNNIGFARRIDKVPSLVRVESKEKGTTRKWFHIIYQKK